MEPNRLGDISAFLAAVKTGSFTAAAASLGLTRSAVGKSIVRLESRVGLRLLNRTTRKLSLTDEGFVVYERWSQILEDLDEVDATMALRKGTPTGTLRLTAPLSFGQRHVLPLVEAFLKEWPQLRADISFTDRYVDLVEDSVDMAIRIGGVKEDSLIVSRTIGWQQFATCASPEYLQRRGIPQVPGDLAGHDTLFFMGGQQAKPWQFQLPQGPQFFEGPGRLHMDNSEGLRDAALSGFGLIHLPTYITGADLQSGRLVEVLQPYRPAPDPIRLLYPSKRHLSPRTRAFIDLLVERWQSGVPWEAFTPG
ncbi:LysR family transcriptional regulator [Pseudomonas sp. MYb118]|uniref:LysR family transcriptional regulator n=1 Tax=Pseudomonas sp. MYb118 TaxID=1848720 RepID=UPI0034CDC441